MAPTQLPCTHLRSGSASRPALARPVSLLLRTVGSPAVCAILQVGTTNQGFLQLCLMFLKFIVSFQILQMRIINVTADHLRVLISRPEVGCGCE